MDGRGMCASPNRSRRLGRRALWAPPTKSASPSGLGRDMPSPRTTTAPMPSPMAPATRPWAMPPPRRRLATSCGRTAVPASGLPTTVRSTTSKTRSGVSMRFPRSSTVRMSPTTSTLTSMPSLPASRKRRPSSSRNRLRPSWERIQSLTLRRRSRPPLRPFGIARPSPAVLVSRTVVRTSRCSPAPSAAEAATSMTPVLAMLPR
mmetsp:Transcript_1305/g.3753  ORF Transcript_1305/g.3753 Transcript_1305/m.3753 type:complete len:204 (+) Transcript_1305:1323-1934(+)